MTYDPNYRANLWPDSDICRQTNKQLAQLVDIALVSKEDHITLWGHTPTNSIASTWSSWGTPEIIVKDGGNECVILKGDQETCVSAHSNITPVDTTGAGDSFAAGCIGSRLLSLSAHEAATKAHSIAAQVVQRQGAISN
ncbi:PfkB family carbohydrate kinase [Pseudovibrio sp. Ad5]|uniref:PfkB family carbohydrate kinase n=1 Tax=Pseudovibrio sp. Ad5 TaxID=989436 RepID=UPI0023AA68EB|nr:MULTISPECIES: PfkB family carbohydrate kinase [unclassified Pseudovibrio]